MYLFGLNVVTMETFVDQRSLRTPPSMVYITLDQCYNSDERTDNLLEFHFHVQTA